MTKVKQQNLVREITENQRKPKSKQKSDRQLIKDAGYSQHTADHPAAVLKTKSWEELLEIYLPDYLIAQALHKSIISNFGHVRNQAVDIVAKIKDKYAATKFKVEETNLTDEQLKAKLDEIEALRKKRLEKK